MIKRIFVNQYHIRANDAAGNTALPVIAVYTGDETILGHEIEIQGPSAVVYQPLNPLPCGAHVWVEVGHDTPIVLNGRVIL
jgi:hypothetical protein